MCLPSGVTQCAEGGGSSSTVLWRFSPSCPAQLQLFVEKLHWTTHLVFTELLMLGQCMPGPTSTQMAFAIGVLKKGLSGGLLSGAALRITLPL